MSSINRIQDTVTFDNVVIQQKTDTKKENELDFVNNIIKKSPEKLLDNPKTLIDRVDSNKDIANKKAMDSTIDLTDGILGKKILERAQHKFQADHSFEKLDYWPETLANKLFESKKHIKELNKKTHVTVVVPVYNEITRMQTKAQNKNGEDFVREKIRQLDWFKDCENFSWDMMIVDDGCPHHSGEEAQKIVTEFSRECGINWPVSVNYLKEGIDNNGTQFTCPAIANLNSTKDSRKGGAIQYGLWKSIENNHLDKQHVIVYTDADLSSHLGNIGFMVNQIVNEDAGVSIGSRKLDPSLVKKSSNPKAGKLWSYFRSSFFPHLNVTDTQVGFKAFDRDVVANISKEKMVEHGLCFDLELLVLAGKQTKPIKEFPLLWIDSVEASTINGSKDNDFLQMLQTLSQLYQKYGEKNKRGDAFCAFVSQLDVKQLNCLLDNCPKEIYEKSSDELAAYTDMTPSDLQQIIDKHLT